MSRAAATKASLGRIKDGDFAGALEELREVFRADPDDAAILVLVGLCNAKLGAHEAAEKAYRKCTAKGTLAQQLQAWLGLASMFGETGQMSEQLKSLDNAMALLVEGGGNEGKLQAVKMDRAKLLVKTEAFEDACVALAELDKGEDTALLLLRCEALEGRAASMEREAIKAATLASGLTAKQQAAKEAELHALACLPDDLLACYTRAMKIAPEPPADVRCRFVLALFDSASSLKHAALLWQLLAAAAVSVDAHPVPDDWRILEVVALLGRADDFVIGPQQVAHLRDVYLDRFTHRNLAKLLATLGSAAKVEEVNAALLKEPRCLEAWLRLLQIHELAGAWKTVEAGAGLLEGHVAGLSAKTGLTFSSVTADAACFKARAMAKTNRPDAAIAEFKKALAARPSHSVARMGVARLQQAKGELAEALKMFERGENADDEEAQSLRGMLLAQSGESRWEEAKSVLEKAEKRFPQNAAFHYWLGRVYWEREAMRLDKDLALRQFLLAVKANPLHADSFAWLGRYYDLAGDPGKARRAHAKAFELDNSQLESALFLSNALHKEKESTVAAAKLHASVLRVAPMCKWAAQRLGVYLLQTGQAEQALGAFQSMIRADASDPHGWEGLGDTYRAQGKFMASLQAYDRATAIDSGRFLAHFRAGSVLRAIGRAEEALVRLRLADAVRPDNVPVLHEMVLAGLSQAAQLSRLGLVQAARNALVEARTVALRLAGSHAIQKPVVDVDVALARLVLFDAGQKETLLQEALSAVARMEDSAAKSLDWAACKFMLSGSNQEVLQKLDNAMQASTQRSVTFNALLSAGAILASSNRMALAHKCFIEASKLDDRSARPLLALAALYMTGGRPALAQRAYARAVALEPDLPEAWTGQGLLNELQGGAVREAEARMLYASVAAVRADVHEANLGLGRVALACGDAFQAEMGLLRALDRDPTSAEAQYMLALAFERQGRLSMALDLLSRIRLPETSLKGHAASNATAAGQTVVLHESHSWPMARKQRAIVATQARVAAQMGRYEEALGRIASCSEPLVWHELALAGYASLRLGHTQRGLEYYKLACERADKEHMVAALTQMCRALAASGQLPAAVALAKSVRVLRPQLLAALGSKVGDAKLVLEAVAGDVWSDSGAQSSWRAKAVELEGNSKATLAELQRAVRQDPSRLSAWAALASYSASHHPLGLHRIARVAGGPALPHLLSRAGKYAGVQSRELSQEVRAMCQQRAFADPGSDAAWKTLAWAQFSCACVSDWDEDWRLAFTLLAPFADGSDKVACAVSECHLHLRDAEAASAAIAKCRADSACVLRATARISLFQGKSREALRLYAAAVKSREEPPLREQCLVEMSEVFVMGRDFAAAEHCLRMVEEPRGMSVTLRLVHVLVVARKEEEAKTVAATLPEVPRDHFAGNIVLGLLALRCGAMKAAERRLERAAATEPASPAVHELLSQCLMKKSVKEAEAELRREIELYCGSEAAAMRSLWRLDKSKLTLQRCLHLDPSQVPMWKELAK